MYVMDLSSTINEIDTPFLVDSGTESYTESPRTEEDSEQSEDSTICNTDDSHDQSISKCNIQLHILDKLVSVDEDDLTVPLVPIRTDPELQTNSINKKNEEGDNKTNCEPDNLTKETVLTSEHYLNTKYETAVSETIDNLASERSLPSILRRISCYEDDQQQNSVDSSVPLMVFRKVSFPTNYTELASYKEPEFNNPWTISTYLSAEKILNNYQVSCKQHQTIELDSIKHLILDIKNNTNYSAILNLSMINITREVNETLEDLLKISNFRTLILHECKFTCETISEFLNMLEYYESVREIEIAVNFEDIDAWKYFCNTCSSIYILESLSFKGIKISDTYMRMLLYAINNNPEITVLKFDTCTLVKLPSFYLVENLMTNTTLRELYLPSTGLYTKEADCLGRFLQKNFHLKVLDISNNFIGDRGLEVLSKGLIKQNIIGLGLSVLVIFNNQITEKSGSVINNIILNCKNLHTLNIGYNNLTDEVLSDIYKNLSETQSLEGLGLQCTLLTCKGINFLAEAIENNSSLKKVNLKGNKAIQVQGLEKLCQALTTSKVSKIEIDETNRSANDPEAYVQMVKRMNAICIVNKSMNENDEATTISQLISRKVSLSCEPKFVIPESSTTTNTELESTILTSSMPPRVSSPAPKSRFQITKVQDNRSRPTSRFKVTKVFTSPTEEETTTTTTTTEHFVNVRSSVSSDDSVSSLQLDSLDLNE